MRYTKAAHILSVVGILTLPLALIIPALAIMKSAGIYLPSLDHTGVTTTTVYLALLVVLAPSVLLIKRFPGADFSVVGKKFNLTTAAVALVFVLSAMFAGGALRNAFEAGEESSLRTLGGHFAATGSLEFILTWVAVGILAPIVEELAFRHYLFSLFPYRKNLAWSIGVASLMAIVFSAVHAQYNSPITFGLIAVISFGFGMARIITGGILLPIMMHAMVNNMSLISMALAPANAG